MSRLLVTGGAGFIGANFVHYWLRHHPGDRLIVLDALSYAGNRVSLAPVEDSPDFRFVHGNICDQELIEDLLIKEKIDTLVHFAAETHVDRSIMGPDAFIENNIVGTHSLLKAARNVWLQATNRPLPHRFHHVSTDEVYGSLEKDASAFRETTPYSPRSPYSASKASSDHLVRAYGQTYELEFTLSNCSNNFGPYQFPEKLIPLMLINILEGKPLPIYGDGLNVRDWLYVGDHCRGIELILRSSPAGETYNIGGNNEKTNIDVIKLLCHLVDETFQNQPDYIDRYSQAKSAFRQSSESLITFVKDRPGHDRRYAINASKIERELGFKPKESFESGLQKTIRWYLENESWWRKVMDGSYREWIEKQYVL